jgi:hypothetical protein
MEHECRIEGKIKEKEAKIPHVQAYLQGKQILHISMSEEFFEDIPMERRR